MENGRGGTVHAGLSYGIVGAVLGFCAFATATLARLLGGFGLLNALGFLAAAGALAVIFWSGVAPARASGRAASGTGAGAFAGACTGAGALIGMLVDGTQNGTIPPPTDLGGTLGYLIGVVIILVGAAALFACLGAGLGALGGLIGRGQALLPDASATSYPPVGAYPTARNWQPLAGGEARPTPPESLR